METDFHIQGGIPVLFDSELTSIPDDEGVSGIPVKSVHEANKLSFNGVYGRPLVGRHVNRKLLANKLNKATKCFECGIASEIYKGKLHLGDIINNYEISKKSEEGVREGLADIYSLAYLQLANILSDESKGVKDKGISGEYAESVWGLISTAFNIKDVGGQPSYLITKTILRSLRNNPENRKEIIGAALDFTKVSLKSNPKNYGSIVNLQYLIYLTQTPKLTDEKIGRNIEKFIKKQLKGEQVILTYYLAKLADNEFLGNRYKQKATVLFQYVRKNLPTEEEDKRIKSTIYLAIKDFLNGNFLDSKKKFLEVIKSKYGRTREVFRHLYEIHKKSTGATGNTDLDVKANIPELNDEDEWVVVEYFKNHGVDLDPIEIDIECESDSDTEDIGNILSKYKVEAKSEVVKVKGKPEPTYKSKFKYVCKQFQLDGIIFNNKGEEFIKKNLDKIVDDLREEKRRNRAFVFYISSFVDKNSCLCKTFAVYNFETKRQYIINIVKATINFLQKEKYHSEKTLHIVGGPLVIFFSNYIGYLTTLEVDRKNLWEDQKTDISDLKQKITEKFNLLGDDFILDKDTHEELFKILPLDSKFFRIIEAFIDCFSEEIGAKIKIDDKFNVQIWLEKLDVFNKQEWRSIQRNIRFANSLFYSRESFPGSKKHDVFVSKISPMGKGGVNWNSNTSFAYKENVNGICTHDRFQCDNINSMALSSVHDSKGKVLFEGFRHGVFDPYNVQIKKLKKLSDEDFLQLIGRNVLIYVEDLGSHALASRKGFDKDEPLNVREFNRARSCAETPSMYSRYLLEFFTSEEIWKLRKFKGEHFKTFLESETILSSAKWTFREAFYHMDKGDDREFLKKICSFIRTCAAKRMAQEMIAYSLLREKDLSRLKDGDIVRLRITSMSILTPHHITKEDKMLANQYQALRGFNEENVTIALNDGGDHKKITVVPTITCFNYGVNFLSKLHFGKSASEHINKTSFVNLIAEAENFIKNRAVLKTGDKKFEIIAKIVEYLKHKDKFDVKYSYELPVRILYLAYLLGHNVAFNCKSGKDRTGVFDSFIKYFVISTELVGYRDTFDMSSLMERDHLIECLKCSGNLEFQLLTAGHPGFKIDITEGVKGSLKGADSDLAELLAGITDNWFRGGSSLVDATEP